MSATDDRSMRRAMASLLAALAALAHRLHGGAGLRAPDGPVVRARSRRRRAGKSPQPRDDAPRGGWWEAFGDPDLDALERRSTSPTRRSRRRRRACARRGPRPQAARAGLFPVASTSTPPRCAARAPPADGTSASSSAVANSYNVALDLSWEIDLWGRIRRGVEASEAGAQASAADLAAARLSVQASLAQNYLLLRVQDAQIRSARGHRRRLRAVAAAHAQPVRRRHRRARRRRAGGGAAQVDAGAGARRADRARAARARDRRPDRQAAGGARDRPADVRRGLSRDSRRACRRNCSSAGPTSPRPSGASRARTRRSASRRPRSSRRSRCPARAACRARRSAAWLSLPSRYWSLGAALAQTLFDAGLRSAQKAQAIAAYDETVAAYRSTVLDGFQEVEDNLVALALLEQEAAVQDDAVKAARESATIAPINTRPAPRPTWSSSCCRRPR